MKKIPFLTIDFGSMFSGKSQEVYRRCAKIADALANAQKDDNKSIDTGIVLFIVYKEQSARNAESVSKGFTTHASNFSPSNFLQIIEVDTLGEVPETLLQKTRYIGIDEAFYSDLFDKVYDWFINRRISISIACIDGSATQKVLCPQIIQLLPYATRITKHSAYCHFCMKENKEENAYYTIQYAKSKSLTSEHSSNENNHDEKDLGGGDKYRSACLNHLIMWRNKTI